MSRAGGDRFCVILDRLREPEDGTLVAERIAEFLSRPFEVGRDEISLSVSIGVVTSEGDYQLAEDMLNDAKAAMAEVKKKLESVPEHAAPLEDPLFPPAAEQETAPREPPALAHRTLVQKLTLPLAVVVGLVAILALTTWLRPASEPDAVHTDL